MIEARFEMHGEEERENRLLLMDTDKNCFECRHMRLDQETCDAFPDGIPSVFLYGDKAHTRSYPGDHDIQFEPRSK